MAAAIVTIICIAMIVVGGMTLSQGILTSTDSAVLSMESISVREGDIMRTNLEALRAAQLAWGNDLRVTVKNSGQTKLASFGKWDFIVSYLSADSQMHSTWLPYTTAILGANQWQKARIGLDGPLEYFEPGILNPGEEMVIMARLDPAPGNTNGDISLTTPNGINDAITLINPGYLRLTPQAENISLNNTKYYELVEAATADGPAMTAGTEFGESEGGRKLLYNTGDAARPAKFIYPLIGITQIPAETWTVTYRCLVTGEIFPQSDTDTQFSISIVVRQANGNIRDTIVNGAASAFITSGQAGTWVTVTATYAFPGYTVIDSNDYLEIDFYGETASGPDGGTGYMQLSIDDGGLPAADQTRIEAL
jgi:hypothetical protein